MSTLNQTEILWDKYNRVPDVYPGSSFIANQAVGSAAPQIVPTKQSWSSTIPATAPTDLGSVVPFTNGSYRQSASYPWIRKYTVTMGTIQNPGISYWYASTNVNSPETTNVCRDTIPFNYDPLGSYNISVFANGVAVSPTYTAYPWNYDGDAGTLTFYPVSLGALPPTPITMTYWRYVGGKGGGSQLTYWTIEDPSPGSILYFTPSSGTAANIYMTDSAQFLLAGPGNGYIMYDRTNTSAYWDTYSSGNVLNWAYNGAGTDVTKGSLDASGNLSITSITVGGTQNITLAGSRTTFSGGNGITVQSGISVGTAYASTGIVGISGILNAGTTNFLQIYDSTITNILYSMNSTGTTTTLPITASSFIGPATRIATTRSPTTSATYYPLFASTLATNASQIAYTDGKTSSTLSYNPNTGILTATGFSGGASGLNTTVTATQPLSYIPFVNLQTGTNQTVYTDGAALGGTSLSYNSTIQTLNVYNTNTSYATVGGLNINTGISLYDTLNVANYWGLQSYGGILTFNNQWSGANYPLKLNGDVSSVTTTDILAGGNTPSASVELDTPVVTGSTQNIAGTYNNGAVYTSTTTNDYSALGTTSYTALTFNSTIALPVIGDNPNGRYITVSCPVSAAFKYAFTAAGTITLTLTGVSVSMTRNGTNFTNWSFISPTVPIAKTYTVTGGTPAANGTLYTVQSPVVQVIVKFIPTNSYNSTDTYNVVFSQTATGTTTGGGGAPIFQPFLGVSTFYFPVNQSIVNTITPTPASGFAFPAAGTVTAMAITKSLSATSMTLNGDYVNANFLNLVYQRTFSSTVTANEELCFASGYTNYNIVWYFSSAPTAYTSLYLDLVTKAGVNLGASFSGNAGILGSAYASVAWSATQAFICYCAGSSQRFYYATITQPNLARRKTITATNNGSASVSLVDVPIISTGTNSSAVSYPSMLWGVVGTAVNGTVSVYGWN